jgi:hypothetical protein
VSDSDKFALALQGCGMASVLAAGVFFNEDQRNGIWIVLALLGVASFVTAAAWMIRGLLFEMFKYWKEHR